MHRLPMTSTLVRLTWVYSVVVGMYLSNILEPERLLSVSKGAWHACEAPAKAVSAMISVYGTQEP